MKRERERELGTEFLFHNFLIVTLFKWKFFEHIFTSSAAIFLLLWRRIFLSRGIFFAGFETLKTSFAQNSKIKGTVQ